MDEQKFSEPKPSEFSEPSEADFNDDGPTQEPCTFPPLTAVAVVIAALMLAAVATAVANQLGAAISVVAPLLRR
jgi:hypothetical protein